MENARIREEFAGNVGVAFAEPPDPGGLLSVIVAYGHTHLFKGSEGLAVTVRLHDRALHH